MRRHAGPALLAALAALAVAVPTGAAAAGPGASAAATCSVHGQERTLGPTYVTALSAKGTSCAKAKSLVRAFYACRVANGGPKGRCVRTVKGYRCSEQRMSIPTQFSSKVTCHKGSATVKHTYTQYT